jgi:hypothetical protein
MATDNGAQLTLDCRRCGVNGKVTVTARLGDKPVHVDTFDITCAKQRDEFADAVARKCPGIDATELQEMLLRLADEHVREEAKRADNRPPPGANGQTDQAAQRASVPGSDRQGGEQPSKPAVPPWQPFPVDVLPSPAREFVTAAAAALKTNEVYVALPLLAMLGSLIGNARRLKVKKDWFAPPILWTVVVGESGQGKSPAYRMVLEPIRALQQRANEEYEAAVKKFLQDLEVYEREKARWHRGKSDSIVPPEKPAPPPMIKYWVSDITVEALAMVLQANPRGVLLARDELAGWIGSFDRYAGNKGRASADAAHWLEMYNGGAITVDRKTGHPPTIYVPMAAVSITGTIQPGILRRALGVENRENGLAARLLLAYPPRVPREWSEAEVSKDLKKAIERVVAELIGLQPVREGKAFRPCIVKMDENAKAAYVNYFNAHNREGVELEGDLSAAWAKLEETSARLALIVHYVRWANGDVKDEFLLDEHSMRAGIALAEWFKQETVRVYAILDETEDDRDRRRLVEWLIRHGGKATASQVQAGCRWLRAPGAAEDALNDLRKAGLGDWHLAEPGKGGGRPGKVFCLSAKPNHVSGTPAKPWENRGFADKLTIDTVTPAKSDPQHSPGVAASDGRETADAVDTDKTDSPSGDSREAVLVDKADAPAPALSAADTAAPSSPSANPPKADGQAGDSLEEELGDLSDLFEEPTDEGEWHDV